MSTNDEMRAYLDFLLSHERSCAEPDCSMCQSARNIYESVRNVIFSGVAYPEVAIVSRRGPAPSLSPNGARKTAKRAA